MTEEQYTLVRQDNGELAIIDRKENRTMTEDNDGDEFRDYLPRESCGEGS
jgi:hypothetical protein